MISIFFRETTNFDRKRASEFGYILPLKRYGRYELFKEKKTRSQIGLKHE